MISKGTKYKILLASGTIILLTVIWDLKTVKYKQLEVSESVTNIKYALNRYKLFKTIKYEDQLNVFLSNIRSEGKYMFVELCHYGRVIVIFICCRKYKYRNNHQPEC